MIKCGIYYTNYGLDYQAIKIEFDILVLDWSATDRLL
jgi:hypothetical protein